MCDICGSAVCVPLCPRHEEQLQCTVCGGAIGAQDDALEREGRFVCSLCMENLSVQALLALTVRRGARDFLRHELGFVPRV